MQSIERIMNIPTVESSWNYAGHFYGRMKESNNVIHWAFQRAETSFGTIFHTTTTPVVILFRGPLSTLDKLLCQSLDVVEKKVPAINLPPKMIFSNTKEYVNEIGNRIMCPILKRADSVKQMGNNVLESKYTTFAADTLEGALTVADKYVDIYLPSDGSEVENPEKNLHKATTQPGRKAIETIQHMDRFSRKLQRRLTRRTFAEAKALKIHSTEAIHVLVYILELISDDPKLAHYKSKELWASLSNNEPENQARPENLEELVVMLTRESARRVVHFVNFTNAFVTHMPDQTRVLANKCLNTIDETFRAVRAGDINRVILETARIRAHKFTLLLYQLNLYTTELLEQVAKRLEQQEQNIKRAGPVTSSTSAARLPLPPPPVASSRTDGFRSTSTTVQMKSSRRYTSIANGTDNTNP